MFLQRSSKTKRSENRHGITKTTCGQPIVPHCRGGNRRCTTTCVVSFSVASPSARRKKDTNGQMNKTAESPPAMSIVLEQEVNVADNADVSFKTKMAETGGNRMLVVCFLGIFVCYFVYGVLQETMWVTRLSQRFFCSFSDCGLSTEQFETCDFYTRF